MKLTVKKKDGIRRALVAKTFPDERFTKAAEPLIKALEENDAVREARLAATEHPWHTGPSTKLEIYFRTYGAMYSLNIPLPFRYARYGGFADLKIIKYMNDEESVYRWSSWDGIEGLPNLENEDIVECLKKLEELLEQKYSLDRMLYDAMSKITTAESLVRKIPATREFLAEELDNATEKSKTVIPMDLLLKVRKMLGYA